MSDLSPTIVDLRKKGCSDLREWVEELVEALDNLDEVEMFGHEGWRSMLMGE